MKLISKNIPFHCILLILWMALGIWSKTAVISGMKVVSGKRGLALEIEADASFELSTKMKQRGEKLTLIMPGAVFGLTDYTYSSFPVGSLIRRIDAQEVLKKDIVEIVCTFDSPIENNVRVKKKDSRWLILVTDEPQIKFSWIAPQPGKQGQSAPKPPKPSVEPREPQKAEMAALEEKKEPEPVPEPVPQPAVPSPAPAIPAKSEIQNSGFEIKSKITNFLMLHRDKVKKLHFELDAPANAEVKREKGIYKIALPYTRSTLPKKKYTLSDGYPFSTISFKQRRHKNVEWCIIFVSLEPGYDGSILLQKSASSFSVYPVSDMKPQLTIWGASTGKKIDYSFTNLPSYKSDYDRMTKKVEAASEKDIPEDATFALKEPAPKKEVQEQPQKSLQPEPDPEPQALRKPEPEPEVKATSPVRLVVIKDNVNFRAKPEVSGKKTVIKQLRRGTMGTQIAREGEWYKADMGGDVGWVYHTMVQDSATIDLAFWNEIESSEEPSVDAEEEEILAAIQKKSTQIPPIESESKNTIIAQTERGGVPAFRQIGREIPDRDPGRKELVEYHVYGRDPFLPLEEISTDSLPEVANIKLVGVLLDETERLALVEDINDSKNAFALRENDPVRGGRVLKIQDHSIVFLLNELGISRTYALKLNEEKHSPVSNFRDGMGISSQQRAGQDAAAAADGDADDAQSGASNLRTPKTFKGERPLRKIPDRKSGSSVNPSSIPY
ncbi:MAG: hypothetical protein GF401_11845 [Chitinivibrionales bacterium]|nr:hypothetical protein [Chitinivibrionales bacterium]